MKKINYPLIVSDFDGTLVRSDGTIAEETRKTIDEYIACGGTFGICTGRMLTSILPRARELGLKGLVASYQGSVVADIESGRLLVDGYIPPEEAAEICRLFESMNLHIHLYELDKFYANREDAALADYERVCQVKGIVANDEPLSELVMKKRPKIRKVLALVSPEEKLNVYRKAEERLGDRFYVTYSTAQLVEITSKRYSKGTAVEFMAEYYKVPIQKTLAVGDGLNDLPMLETAGIGLAVKNADEALKNKAEIFPYTNEENAVGRIIEEYGFDKEKI